jgi:hypothetical protein
MLVARARAALDFLVAFDSLDRSMAKVMVGARVEQETLARLDRVAAVMGDRAAGASISRSDAARVALELGVEALERRFGLAVDAGEPPPPAPHRGERRSKAKS